MYVYIYIKLEKNIYTFRLRGIGLSRHEEKLLPLLNDVPSCDPLPGQDSILEGLISFQRPGTLRRIYRVSQSLFKLALEV